MRAENLLGTLPQRETELILQALYDIGSRNSLWHPQDRAHFDATNPLAGICDLSTALTFFIYFTKDHTQKQYANWIHVQKMNHTGWKPQDYDVHYDAQLLHYGRVDFTRAQFEDGRIFKDHGKKKIDVQKRIPDFRNAEMNKRLPVAIEILRTLALQENSLKETKHLTPEFIAFVNQ